MFVHASNGIFVGGGGWELVGATAALLAAFTEVFPRVEADPRVEPARRAAPRPVEPDPSAPPLPVRRPRSKPSPSAHPEP